MNKISMDSLKKKLDVHYAWPSVYPFKFIIPKEQQEELRTLFVMHEVKRKESKNGKYIGFTINMMMPSSEAVLAVYRSATNIKGVIAL